MNYIVPEDFDFYKELEASLNSKEESETNNVCLITNKPLIEDANIKLECGHTFNYVSICNEVYESKYGNHYQNNYGYAKLRDHQIRCPYCRQIQDTILPYFPDVCKMRVRGVNYPLGWSMGKNECNYVFKSGKNKGNACGKQCYREKCHQHFAKSKVKSDFDASKVEKREATLKKYSLTQLRQIAKFHKKKGYSKLKKNDLIIHILEV